MVAREPETGFRYWAFISYSHQDTSWGRWLHRALETYRLPQRLVGQPIAAGTIPPRLTPVFRDRDELPTATDLDRTVAEALRQSWCLIVICSPASAQSRWVNEEVREFQQLGRGERIHCLIVDGSADAAAAPCFPPALRERRWHAAAAGEPIAADARRSGDGKANARLKLVAGILGVSFDKLVQRDQQRGYRRMAVIATAAVLALALLTVFTIVTVTSRRDAEAQRGHAEGLVEFMLGDLRGKLEPEGKLAILDAVGKQALAYYATQDPGSLSRDALAHRARALHQIGEVDDLRGRLDDASDVFRQAAETTGELLNRDPVNTERIFDHAQSAYWVGYVAWRRGDVAMAEAAFGKYKQLADRLVALGPDNPKWQVEVEYANNNLGTLLLDGGRSKEAAAAFAESLRIAQSVSRRAPQDVNRQIELAQVHAWLADSLVAEGNLQQAVRHRQTEIALYESILALDAKNEDVALTLLIAERALGKLSLLLGDLPGAAALLNSASESVERLLQLDTDNTSLAETASGVQADLGEVLDDLGDRDVADTHVSRARSLATQLVERDPTVVRWQLNLARSLLLQARMQGAAGDPKGALRMVQGVIQRLETLRKPGRPDRNVLLLYANALIMATDHGQVAGYDVASKETLDRVVSLLSESPASSNPQLRALLAIALRKLGREEESARVEAGLSSIGYREPDYARRLERPPATVAAETN